jgi:hypothetical protein
LPIARRPGQLGLRLPRAVNAVVLFKIWPPMRGILSRSDPLFVRFGPSQGPGRARGLGLVSCGARQVKRSARRADRERAGAAQTRSQVHGRRHRAIDRGFLEPRCIPLRDHPEDGGSRYRRRRLSGIRRRRRQLAVERPCRDGVGACRCVGGDVLGRAHGPFGRIDLSVRGRAAEATLATVHDALRQGSARLA